MADYAVAISSSDELISPPLTLPMPTTTVEDSSSNNILQSFLDNYPTPLQSSSLSSLVDLRVYWSHDDDDPQLIQDKIRCAFQNLQLVGFGGIVQFWAPTVSGCGKRQLLTTSDQPFILSTVDDDGGKYRLCCLEYRYFVNGIDNNNVGGVEEEDGDVGIIITDGAAATTFLNQTPELLPDLEVAHQQIPCLLLSAALDCGWTCCVMVPVFDPALSCCVGVVECCVTSSLQLFDMFNALNTVLETEGLKTFHARDRLPYKTIPALEHAKNEIDDALKFIAHSHGLVYADVWIAYKDRQPKRVIGLKLTDNYSVNLENDYDSDYDDDYDDRCFASYSDACYGLPLKIREGLIGKTFQNYKPYFVKDIWKLSDKESALKKFFYSFRSYSWFVIYLKSTKTNDLDYIFEFSWKKGRDSVILMEQVLLTLKRYLPSFKLESSVELGNELYILDVMDATMGENKYIKIFQRNKISVKRGRQSKVEECLTPLKPRGKTTPIELSRERIVSQFGQTQEKAAKKLQVHVSTLKRKVTKLGIKWQGKDSVEENESDTNEEEDNRGAIQDSTGEVSLDKNMVRIKAEYAGFVTIFSHPILSATSKAMEKEIVKRYELDPATRYKLQYLDVENNEWILFTCDENVTLFQKDKRNVRLRLLT